MRSDGLKVYHGFCQPSFGFLHLSCRNGYSSFRVSGVLKASALVHLHFTLDGGE